MEQYQAALEKIADREASSAIFSVPVLLVIVGVIWGCRFFCFKRMKNKRPQKYTSEKQMKIRRQSILASIVLTVICVGMASFLVLDAADIVSKINRDIEDNAYITYVGGYRVSDDMQYSGDRLYDRWLSVVFDNDDVAFVYMDSLLERISTDEGSFEGKVVYGKNSLFVVDIDH